MALRFDHIVHCVRNLDAAARTFQGMGFTLTPVARHPFGTHNRLALMTDNFIELLAVADEGAIPPSAPDRFSFGDYNRLFLRGREGVSMLAFQGSDGRADAAAFSERGLQTYEPFQFSRTAALPDGATARLTFSLAFVRHPAMPELVMFTSAQHHPPDHFWKSEYQRHENSALRFEEVVLAAGKNWSTTRTFLEQLTGDSADLAGGVLTVGSAGHRLTVLGPEQLALRFPGSSGLESSAAARVVAYGVRVAHVDRLAHALRQGSVPYLVVNGRLVVLPQHAHGVFIEFSAA